MPPECFERADVRSLSLMGWDMNFPEDWLCSLTVMAPKVVGATCLTKFRPSSCTVCDAESLWAMCGSSHSTPLKYESVQTAFVPKTHAQIAGLFLLLQAAELSRERQREIVVLQLDVKKASRPCGPSSGLQGNETARCEFVFDGFDCGNLDWKLHEGMRLGTVSSNKVQMSRGLPPGAPESPVIFTMIMELVLRDLIKSWITRKLAWRRDDFVLAAICYADDVVLIAVSMSAAEIMVKEVIEKLKEVGMTVGAQKNNTGRVIRR